MWAAGWAYSFRMELTTALVKGEQEGEDTDMAEQWRTVVRMKFMESVTKGERDDKHMLK